MRKDINIILEELNEPQREAVLRTEGPLMIIAGAGSGKTKVLTYRIAYLLHKGIDPFQILSLTFTNKAAKEMRERIEHVVGSDAKNLWMGTFHSVFARILRSEAEKIGYPSNFTVYDTDDSKSLIRTILKEMGLDDKVYKVNGVLSRISSAKNKLVSFKKYQQDPFMLSEDQSSLRPKMGEIYQKYVQRCFKAGAMDFDDLLFNTNVLFRDCPDILNKYQHRFKYVMVDEYQDTNLSQYLITKKLAAIHENICVVGDDAQSIYAFRGADIQNILNFEKDYPELHVVKLEQNYRSTQNIVEAANNVIRNNEKQLKKDVWTKNEQGSLIEVLKAGSENEEGKMVANAIFEARGLHQLKNKDFAILYRTNSQSRALEEALRRVNINYKVIGGTSFYQRKEVKDLLAYLRFTVNTNDEESLKRIINYPKRAIGDSTVAKMVGFADEQGISIWDVVQNPSHVVGGKSAQSVEGFAYLIKGFALTIKTKDAHEAALQIARESGLMKDLYDDKTVEGLARYANLQELLNGIKEFVDDPEREDHSMGSFLQEVSLLTNADEKTAKVDEDYVTLMTIHSAKGLEFDQVFVVGMEEDLFPSQMMMANRSDLEEERRLFYVAVTRARKKLYLAYALSRYRFGRLGNCEPSRFLEEIDTKYLNLPKKHVNDMLSDQFFHASTKLNTIKKASIVKPTATATAQINHQVSTDFKPSESSRLQEGMKVEHPKFGFGIIQMLDRSGNENKAKIVFDKVGEKTLLLSFAKLMIQE